MDRVDTIKADLVKVTTPQIYKVECRVGGVRLENMVVVTKDGAEMIDHIPREHILDSDVSRRWAIDHTK